MNKNTYLKAWEDADIRDPMIFSLCMYEEPSLMLEVMLKFFPSLEECENFRTKYSLADVLHGVRNDPSVTAAAEVNGKPIDLTLDYLGELTQYSNLYSKPHPDTGNAKLKLNLTLSRSDPFSCNKPLTGVKMSGGEEDDPDRWRLWGILVSLHEEGDVPDAGMQEVIDLFRYGRAEGELSDKIQRAVERVKGNEEWKWLYVEEHVYQDYMKESEDTEKTGDDPVFS